MANSMRTFVLVAMAASHVASAEWTKASAQGIHGKHGSEAATAISSTGSATPTLASIVSVLDFGAIGDAKTDNTAAFAKAIQSLNATGGIVLVPAGKFLIAGSLVLTDGIALVGTYQSVPSHDLRRSGGVLILDGSQLLPTGGRGNASAPAFITVGGNAAVRGVCIMYPEVDPTQVPVPYPWTIVLENGSNNAAVLDVELLNSWNGILADGAARHYIARVQGQPVNIGISIDETYDIGRVENVHWNPWYSDNEAYLSWQDVYGIGFLLARSDWEYFFNTFVFSMSVGYQFVKSAEGACNGNFVGIGADSCQNASVVVDASDPWGILIVNGEFTSFAAAPFNDSEISDHSQIIVSASNTGSVRVSNSAFWGPSHANAKLYGTGRVSFTDCIFDNWDAAKVGRASIEAYGGQVSVRGCEWHASGAAKSPEVLLMGPSPNGTGVTKAIVTDNLIDGPFEIVNNAPAMQIVNTGNLGD